MRTIREEEAARTAVDEASGRWSRANDAWEGITWVLARDPELGAALNESGSLRAYTLDGVRSIDLPTLTLLYEVTDHEIIVRDARFAEADHLDIGRA